MVSLLSKFTIICNIAFVLFIFFRWMEVQKNAAGKSGELISIPLLKELVIILGFTAIIINIIMHLVYLLLYFTKRYYMIPRRLALINFIFLAWQLFYFS
ncbi:MAG: hypothetical protein ABIR81_04065 [Ginsengibacter sp.]